ncbi:MAG: holo-ACP synthase [Actinomycetota bacterium]|nr:holo-ACP synthase [Actinomycetota bacterium]
MDIFGVGTDIIEVERVADSIKQTPSFVSRVFTPEERSYCQSRGQGCWGSYAARFAAKEAVAKSLGTGFGADLSFSDIEISGPGQPRVTIKGRGALLLKKLGISRIEVSISATKNYAVAFAVALKP